MLSISKLGLLVQPEVVHLHPQPVSSPDPPGCQGGVEEGGGRKGAAGSEPRLQRAWKRRAGGWLETGMGPLSWELPGLRKRQQVQRP